MGKLENARRFVWASQLNLTESIKYKLPALRKLEN